MTLIARDPERLIIAGEEVTADVTGAITDVVVERTIDGVTNIEITLHDPDRKLLNSELFAQRSIVRLGSRYELAAVKKQADDMTIVFEDTVVAQLRRHDEPRNTAAGTTTRAGFVRRLVGEVLGEVVGPDSPGQLAQPLSTVPGDTAAGVVGQSGEGIDVPSGDIPSVAEAFSPEGRAPAASSGAQSAGHQEGTQYSPGELAAIHAAVGFAGENLVTIVAISLAESGGRAVTSPPNRNGTLDRGIDQINSVHKQYDAERLISDPYYNATAAFEISGGGSNFQPWTTFWTTDTKRSYKGHLEEARAGVADSTGDRVVPVNSAAVESTGGVSTTAGAKSKPDDWWTALKKIADDVAWRIFCDRGVVWFAPDGWLIARPVLTTISETSAGIDSIDFDFDIGKPVATATLEARSDLWSIPPAAVVEVVDLGVASGRWLVAKTRQSWFSPIVEVELTQPRPAIPEPAHQPTTEEAAAAGDPQFEFGTNIEYGNWTISVGTDVERMVQFALAQEGDDYARAGNGPDAWDCSGLCAAAAFAVGAHLERQTTHAWNQCNDAGTVIPIEQGIRTRGAILWQLPGGPHHSDHMAISLGNGKTIEAMGSAYGVRQGDASRFEVAALVPDLAAQYKQGAL